MRFSYQLLYKFTLFTFYCI